MIIGAPFGFEVEYVKIVVLVTREQMMNQSNFDVLYWVSEGAIVSIFTLLYFVGIAVAELRLILVLVV